MFHVELEQAIARAYFIHRGKGARSEFVDALMCIKVELSKVSDSGAVTAFLASKPSRRSRLCWSIHFERAGL